MAAFDQLVGAVQPVTAEDLECLHNPSPKFRDWVWDAFLTGRIDVFIAAVIHAGSATDVVSALQYLAATIDELPEATPRLAVADFEGRRSRGYRLRELQTLLGGEPLSTTASAALRHGSIGHEAVHALFTDGLLAPLVAAPVKQAVEQLALFSSEPEEQRETTPVLFQQAPPRRREQSFRLSRSIERLWRELAGTITIGATNLLGEADWTGWQRKQSTAARLRRSLSLFFGAHVAKLETIDHDPRGMMHMLTLMSWASAVAEYRRARSRGRVLFREVPVVASAHAFGGGRIDALEVRAINGKAPNRRQLRLLSRIAQERQFRSSGELLRLLRNQFSRPLEIVVIDWKFLVGDIVMNGHDWHYPDLEQAPILEHERQLRRYLTLVPVDYHIVSRESENVWHPRDMTITGCLAYFVPHRLPIFHTVSMSADETEARFVREVVSKWGSATRRSSLRISYNALIRHLVHVLVPGNGNGGKPKRNGAHIQGELFEIVHMGSVQSVVERHRGKIVETVEETGGALERHNGDRDAYLLRYNRLLERLAKGELGGSQHFDPVSGGKVCCIFPDHDDSTPSMQIYLNGGTPRFWCFGCARGGFIAIDSIPQETILQFGDSWRRAESGRRQWEHRQHHRLELEVDDRHHQIMATAQGILAQAFARSPGANYLRTARRLDPDLAARYGAGYGTIEFLSQMIDAGFSFDDLAHYGFLDFSPFVDDRSWAVRLFERHGIPRAQQYRDVRVKGRGKVPGLPYFTLSRRVTFPLSLLGRVNNVYGRAIFPGSKHQAHRKLKVEGSRVKHGGFNMQVLEPDSGHAEVIVLEGVMDALTLIQIGLPNTLAMIGVQNAAILTAVAQSAKAVATGLDLDTTGRKQTTTIAGLLAELGHRNTVRDFTAEFFGSETRFKDFNEWLKAGSPQLGS